MFSCTLVEIDRGTMEKNGSCEKKVRIVRIARIARIATIVVNARRDAEQTSMSESEDKGWQDLSLEGKSRNPDRVHNT